MNKLNSNPLMSIRRYKRNQKKTENPARWLVAVAAAVLGVVVGPRAAAAATYFVSTSGNDSNSCTTAQSSSTPKRTIASGLACVGASDTLYVRGGTYPAIDSNGVLIPTGTSWSDAPRIAAYQGESVTLTGATNFAAPSGRGQSEIKYVIFDGLRFNGASGGGDAVTLWGNVNHVRLQNCEFFNAPSGEHMGLSMQPNRSLNVAPSFNEVLGGSSHDNGIGGEQAHGFYIAGDNNLFDGVTVYNNADRGIQLYSAYRSPSNNIIRNCIFRNNGLGSSTGVGITMYGNNNLAYNNRVYSNKNGFYGTGGSGSRIYNNTVYGNAGYGIGPEGSSPIIKNNIVYNNGSGIDSGGTQSNNLTSNPLFVNAASNDFRLQAGSPAIDGGQSLSEVTKDFVGTPRPQGGAYDIGAYEYGGTGGQASVPPTNLRVVP